MNPLTHECITKLLNYNPETGVFTWRTGVSGVKPDLQGKTAGCLTPSGYRQLRVGGHIYYEHRLAFFMMTGTFPKQQIDHINHNRSDNSFNNLRECSHIVNNQHRKPITKSKTGIRGVFESADKKKFVAEVQYMGTRYRLGTFNTKDLAREAVEAERKELNNGSTT